MRQGYKTIATRKGHIGKIGLFSLIAHFVLPLSTSIIVAWRMPEAVDWTILAVWTAVFAYYQWIVDTFLLRDKPPTVEYLEFSAYIVVYSALNGWGVV